MNEVQRKKLNEERLLLIDEAIRNRVSNVITELEQQGLRPVIAKEVWRDPALQKKLFDEGKSKVQWGFHCATTPDGKPSSLAADIVDAELGWDAPRKFWILLGGAAATHRLHWGGYFGFVKLPKLKQRLNQTLKDKDFDPSIKMGWDPAHVEVKGITIAEAKAGNRPPIA